jgi:hypothetical protein
LESSHAPSLIKIFSQEREKEDVTERWVGYTTSDVEDLVTQVEKLLPICQHVGGGMHDVDSSQITLFSQKKIFAVNVHGSL